MELERFVSLWHRFGADADWAGALYQDVYTLYATPGRYYHAPAHIAHCLRRKDEIAHLLEDSNTVELALWFHDVIYEIGANDNEVKSAGARRTAGDSLLPKERVVVYPRIVYRRTYRPDVVVDIDLSFFYLAAVLARQCQRKARIKRRTPPSTPKNNSTFSKCCTAQPFFFTDFYLERYEQQAQDNIRRILALFVERQQFHQS